MKGIEFVFLAGGAIAGAFLRYKMAESTLLFGTLPVNILAVNVLGSFILGTFSVLALSWNIEPRYSLLIAVGFCGSLTTISSFALETSNLVDSRQFGSAALNILANVGLSIGGIFGGRFLGRIILQDF
jgi:fluoride exporter